MDQYIAKDEYIQMKCKSCGYEEQMPTWCFDEVAEMMRYDNNNDTPHIHCPRCDKPTLYPKK
ncbi:hypothetical protein EDD63_11156 [Breznakia blatticola]|uniref:Uncharacterized protein n=1 Tax=Breznakia blatticola TaxID=1754012 RepID=A0A4R7ZRP4_9FIRM|nr:hypothetical protein [Breznakia blatticola]TDW08934.1 hypothetical protein EDD63_1647 [Breznakia blatticola]TDW20643.1 hypothetical protein EDD63_11156 [Breznakia blatticola]